MNKRILTISVLLVLLLVGIALAPKATFAQSTNLALNKPATASSIEGAGFEAAKAVDGSTSTRWASVDPATTAQWITIDLGAATPISRVVLNWEAAYAKSYQVQVSNDASSWSTIFSTTTGNGATDDLTGLSGSGRYLRVYSTVRGTSYGYSLWEIQVYGGAPTTPPPTTPPPTTSPPTTPPPTTPPPTTPPGQAPYGGTPWAIPGTVQAENYDTGGEGVAYHDTTTGNSGGAYRADAVDIEATTDTGGGYNVGWTAAGEWLEYTISVAASGTYSLNARVASQSTGGTIHGEIDGVNVTGALAIPSTGAWQTWTTVTRTGVSLTAGQHVMRIAMDTAGFNLNWVSLQSGTPPPTTPPPTTPPPTTPPPTTPPPTTPPANKVQWAGVRSSRYGISPFPDACGWTKAMTTMSGYFPGSTPSAAWLTGEIYFNGTNSGQDLNFPNPGGTWDSRIHFASSDQNESYLTYFDTHGIKVFLQFEPGFAPLDQLFQVTYNRYGQHPSVIGFGVDVEWYQSQCDGCSNVRVSDATAQAWENKVKSLNPNYRLFLKHYDAANLPPSYRGNVIFVDDSEQNGSYSSFLNEMINFANTFYPADVIYQIGYPSDKPWWSTLASPIPQTIGNALAARTQQSHMGILWVDFSLRDVLPTTCP